jgi:predicted HicB family RNase H-like nuclease
MAKKRGYSRDFAPRTDKWEQLNISRVPPTLKADAMAKAKREGVSMRALILGWLREWVGK